MVQCGYKSFCRSSQPKQTEKSGTGRDQLTGGSLIQSVQVSIQIYMQAFDQGSFRCKEF